MKKKIVIAGMIVLITLILFYCFRTHTVHLSGVCIEGDVVEDINLTLGYKPINIILKSSHSGTASVQSADGKSILEYNVGGVVLDFEKFYGSDFYSMTVDRLYSKLRDSSGYGEYECDFEVGYIYFDKKRENVAIITSERQIYAASEEFISIVRCINN